MKSWIVLSFLLAPLSASALIFAKEADSSSFATRSTVMVLHEGFREQGRGQCSGTLVASDLVLTAAHCVVNFSTGEDLKASGLTVYFGNYDGRNWNEPLAVRGESLRRHPDYQVMNVEADPTRKVHDIALVKLSRPAPEGFVPARVLLTDVLAAGQPLLLAGFGNIYFMGDSNEPKSRLLRLFETSVETPSHPVSGQMEYWRPTNISTLEDYQKYVGGMAAGDSGGPAYLVLDGIPFVAGVASGYRYENRPFYESVVNHSRWLQETALEWGRRL